MDSEFEQHLETVYGIAKERLVELGIADQMPSKGVFRLLQEIIMDYWTDQEEAQEGWDEDEDSFDYANPDIVLAETKADVVQMEALMVEGRAKPLALVDREEGAIYAKGHKLIVDLEGKVRAYHADGSECETFVACHHCDAPDIWLIQENGESYVTCKGCQHATDLYDSKYLALGAWMVGKTEKEPEL